MIEFFPAREIVLAVGPIVIRWYGVLYVVAFWLGWMLWPYFLRQRNLKLDSEARLTVFLAVLAGLMVGGRLGYVVLYEPHYFLTHPLEIFSVWQGGMSSHGGMVGVYTALAWVSRRLRLPLLALLDSIVVPGSLGLALGRVGNFINQELYGTPTTLPWGVTYEGIPGKRHPAQLYAAAKDLVLAGVVWGVLRRPQRRADGQPTALFLAGYGALRFLVEFVRAPEYPIVQFGSFFFTRGQLYSILLLLAGMLLWRYAMQRAAATTKGQTA